jgi:hypothetical protein
MNSVTAIYRFRLAKRHSIGRKELLALWQAATGLSDVAVTRVESGSGYGEESYTYLLWGPRGTAVETERRMSDKLKIALPEVTTRLIRLSGAESPQTPFQRKQSSE